MGFWDDKVDNPIDSMFDFDRDGELNSTEKAMELDFLSGGNSSNIFLNDDDLYQDLSFTGITKDEFELMDDDEKREALEDAGIDVDDYDDLILTISVLTTFALMILVLTILTFKMTKMECVYFAHSIFI